MGDALHGSFTVHSYVCCIVDVVSNAGMGQRQAAISPYYKTYSSLTPPRQGKRLSLTRAAGHSHCERFNFLL